MSERTTITYQPALDGVRALAVAAVLLFHAEVPGFDGGYLGVSVFFTLSGYLITSLLVAEHDRSGRIELGRFYGRRVRRLLPASAACLAAIVVLAAATDVFEGVAELRNQVVGSILQVANWVFLAGEGSYQELFQDVGGTRSPLEHFWSLAIEEQFYWVWPPTMLGLLAVARTRRARIGAVGAITAVFVVAAPVIAAVWGADAAYWATPARIAEILLGALLAVVLHGRSLGARWAVLAPVSLAGLAACVVLFPPSSGPAYEGWLPAIAVLSVGLIAGLQADGPVRSALSVGPIVRLGTISYGVYLYHWPIYVIADADRLGFDGAPLVASQLALTLAVSVVSFRLLERPIRISNRLPAVATFGGGAAATAAVAIAAVVVVPTAGEYWEVDTDSAAAAAIDVTDEPLEELVVATTTVPTTTVPTTTTVPSVAGSGTPGSTVDGTTGTTATTSTSTSTTTTEPPIPELSRPVRMIVAGDSTAIATGGGLVAWASANPELAQVEVVAEPGCGLVREGERKVGEFEPVPDRCRAWDSRLEARIVDTQPDVVVVMLTSWDLLDYRFDGETRTVPTDEAFQQVLRETYTAATDRFLAAGAGSVAWIRPPIPNVWWLYQGTGQEDPARHAVANGIYASLAEAHPGEVGVVPLDEWLIERGWNEDEEIRPDGVHWEPAAAEVIADEYLGERLIRVALGLA